MADIKTHASLTTGLVSYWRLNEMSGVRYDSHGTNHLTDNNTVGYSVGKNRNAADFEYANSEYLSITDAAQTGLDITGDISCSAWVWIESALSSGEARAVLSKWAAGNGSYSFLYQNNSGTYQLLMQQYDNSDGSTNIGFRVSLGSALATSTWYHVVWTYDTATNTIKVYLDGSYIGQSTGEGTVDVRFSGTGTVQIGGYTLSSDYIWDGLIDEVGIWSKELTADEVSTLYGGGTPPEYSLNEITVDSTSTTWTAAGTSITAPHTITGSDGLLLVMGYIWNGAGAISSITFNGTSLTEIGQQTADGTNGKVYMFGLLSPDTGTHDIVVTASATMQIFFVATSYNGVYQGTPIGSLPKVLNSSTSVAINTDIGDTLTTTAPGSWMVKVMRDPSNGIQVGTPPSAVRILQPISQDSGSCVDTGTALGAAGSYTLYHQHWATTGNSHRVTVAFAPSYVEAADFLIGLGTGQNTNGWVWGLEIK